jgi:II/X family phage/plasmid replication protein
MIDWFRGAITFYHKPLPQGHVVSLKPDNSIDWLCKKKISLRSSWETNLNIVSVVDDVSGGNPYSSLKGIRVINRWDFDYLMMAGISFYLDDVRISKAEAINIIKAGAIDTLEIFRDRLEFTLYEGLSKTLYIDGNLCKFLQGHNVFGSRDLNKLVLLAFKKIIQAMPEHFQGCDLQIKAAERQIIAGEYLVKMIDVNQLYDCGNDLSVEAWLHAAEMRAVCRSGKAKRDKGTVYLAQTSKRWAFKFYNKFREMTAGKAHQLPNELQGLGLESFVTGKLRAEMRIFSKELQERHGITHGKHLDEAVIQHLFNDYLGKITMTAQVTLFDEELMKLPRPMYSTYQHWREGKNLKDMLPKNTFYRHRRMLLEHGIDISTTHLAPEQNNVVPMIRIIEAIPVSIPQWAYDQHLIAM